MNTVAQAPLLRRIFRDAAVTFFSTLLVQAVTFAVSAVSGLILDVNAFARLSIIVATIMLSSGLLEFGLNATATKFYGDTHDEGFLGLAFKGRLALVVVGILAGTVVWSCGWSDIGLGIAVGPVLNVWGGVRATDQARQDYSSVARSSIAFALTRAAGGTLALLFRADATLVALAVYALPVITYNVSASGRFVHRASSTPLAKRSGAARYAAHVHLNNIAFLAVPYVPQFAIASRLDATAVGTYGLILTFTAPVSLLVYSLRSVLLPHMLGKTSQVEGLLLTRWGLIMILALWSILMAAASVVAIGLDTVYGHRFPQLREVFLVYFFGYSGAAAIGFYSLSVHTRGVPHLASALGALKLLILIPAVIACGSDLVMMVSIVALIMILFEILLAVLIYRKKST